MGAGVGGGVIILLKDYLISEQISRPEWENLEIVACMLRFDSKSVLAACIYRPPPPRSTHRYNQQISEAIEQLSDIQADQHIICGDFNYPDIDWLNHIVLNDYTNTNVRDDRRFYDATQNSFLHQHVEEVTRQRGTNVPSLLDLILAKTELKLTILTI